MLCVVSEDTDRVIGERRMATLRDLGSDPSVRPDEQQMLAFAGRQLGRNLRDLPFTLTYLFDEGGDARLAAASGIAAGHPSAPAMLPADGGVAGRGAGSRDVGAGRPRRRRRSPGCRPGTGRSRRSRRWSCRWCSRAARRSGSWSPR